MDEEHNRGMSILGHTAAWTGAVTGLTTLVLGVWALGGAIFAAWGLFKDPGSISYFARYFLDATGMERLLPAGGEGLGHFLAWFTVILLLLVLGKLGAWALEAGARLMLLPRRSNPTRRR